MFVFLEINPLSVASLANIFSHTVGCLFVLFMASFSFVQKLLSLIRSHLFVLCFSFHFSRRCMLEDSDDTFWLTKRGGEVGLGVWDVNVLKLGCDDHCTTII